jgi:two-component system, OmpR family, sensor histidine kinase TctE
MSFAARLLEWLLAPLLFLWLVGLGITFLAARETVDTALDEQLNLAANAIYDEWRESAGNAGVYDESVPQFPSLTLRRLLLHEPQFPIRYLILDERSRPLAGDEDMLPMLRAEEGAAQMLDVDRRASARGVNTVLDEDFVRSLRFSFVADGGVQRLVVVQSRARQGRLLRSILFYEAIPQTVAIIVAVLLVWYGLAYVVRPMKRLKQHLDERDVRDLRSLPTQLAPSELMPLIQSINDLMIRLHSSLGAQNRFIANAAHQLRTPLAAMRAHSELLRRTEHPDRRRETIDQLLATSARANRLANQLLSLVRAESSGTTAEFSDVDLNELCRNVASEVLPLAMERDIEFGFEPSEHAAIVKGDATLLSELVHNLVDNALKYTPKRGSVVIAVHLTPFRIVVEDSGPGISADEREKIFAPFARVARFEADSHHVISGSGLGLAIVDEVARAHRARIGIDRSRFGGAAFSVTFPDAEPSVVSSMLSDPYGQIH